MSNARMSPLVTFGMMALMDGMLSAPTRKEECPPKKTRTGRKRNRTRKGSKSKSKYCLPR